MSDIKKPPLGLIPKEIHDWKRVVEIVMAIERYTDADMPVHKEWVIELKELLEIA